MLWNILKTLILKGFSKKNPIDFPVKICIIYFKSFGDGYEMEDNVRRFISYLSEEKDASFNTQISYERDLKKLKEYLEKQGITRVQDVTETSLNSYVLFLEKEGKAAKTTDEEEKTPDGKEKQEAAETMSDTVSSFVETEKLSWPVQGDVLMNYSMDQTVYFATLNQYKYNPALIIKAEPETEVKAPYAGTIKEIGKSAEIGNYVVVDLGNGYELTLGQLEHMSVKKGDVIKKEQTIGKTALPSKYYSVEGSNIYLKLTKDGNSINPMVFLNS